MDSIQTVFLEYARMMPEGTLLVMTAVSILMFVGTLLLVPLIVVRLPADYFLHADTRVWMEGHHPMLRGVGLAVKNGIGLVFLVAGLAMLVLPGQGLLTMVIGVSLLDFPGKHHLERRLLTNPMVFRAMNAIRHKFGKPALSPVDSPR